MNENNAIEVRNMTKFFKAENGSSHTMKEFLLSAAARKKPARHMVLENINLDIKKGETVALIGTNGSGKSTLLKLMTKIIYPNAGTVETNGKLTSLLELGAGFHIEFTGRENIYFNASVFGLTRKEIDKRVQQIIDFSELGEYIDAPVRTYSSGMFMRLAFAVAINVDADILLIDEILAVGDQHFQNKCYEKLRELKASGKTIVIVTHSLDIVNQLCNRAIWLYKGHFELDGEPGPVIEKYLNQVEIDHQNELKKKQEAGTLNKEGIVFIDTPTNLANISIHDESYEMHGWIVQNYPDIRLKITIDGKEIDTKEIVRHTRKDVYRFYFDMYAGLMDVDTLGWKYYLKPTDYSIGLHKLSVQAVCDQDTILASSEALFRIKDDENE